jgi:hypothetical protein
LASPQGVEGVSKREQARPGHPEMGATKAPITNNLIVQDADASRLAALLIG